MTQIINLVFMDISLLSRPTLKDDIFGLHRYIDGEL